MFSASLTHLLSNKHSRKSPKAQLLEREFDGFRSTLIMMLHVGLNPQPNSSLHPISPVTPRRSVRFPLWIYPWRVLTCLNLYSVAKLTPHYCNYTSDSIYQDGCRSNDDNRFYSHSGDRWVYDSRRDSDDGPQLREVAVRDRIPASSGFHDYSGVTEDLDRCHTN
jgi:hypothetical protein